MTSKAAALKSIIRSRRSIRAFQNRLVPDELLLEVIEAGRMAPSPTNSQPWYFLIFSGKERQDIASILSQGLKTIQVEGFRKLGEEAVKIISQAPHIVAVWNMKHESKRLKRIRGLIGNRYYKNYEQAEVASIGCAVENMWLTAHTLGLGMVWIMAGSGNIKKCARRFGVDGEIVAFLAVGYPEDSDRKKRTGRKSLKEICRFQSKT